MFAGSSPSAADFTEKQSSHSASVVKVYRGKTGMTDGQARGAGKVSGILLAGAASVAAPSGHAAGHPRPARPGLGTSKSGKGRRKLEQLGRCIALCCEHLTGDIGKVIKSQPEHRHAVAFSPQQNGGLLSSSVSFVVPLVCKSITVLLA